MAKLKNEELFWHQSNQYCDDVRRVCYALFKNSIISSFDYAHYYDAGNFFGLNTEPDFADDCYRNHLIPTMQELMAFHRLGLQYTFLGPNTPLPPAASEMNRERYQNSIELAQGYQTRANRFYIVKRVSNAFKLYGFGTPIIDLSTVNFFMNSIQMLMRFIQYFELNMQQQILDLSKSEKSEIYGYHDTIEIDLDCYNLPKVLTSGFIVSHQNDLPDMTRRENQVLTMLSRGCSAKAIAYDLSLSQRTVEKHIENLKKKLNIRSSKELIALYNHYC